MFTKSVEWLLFLPILRYVDSIASLQSDREAR